MKQEEEDTTRRKTVDCTSIDGDHISTTTSYHLQPGGEEERRVVAEVPEQPDLLLMPHGEDEEGGGGGGGMERLPEDSRLQLEARLMQDPNRYRTVPYRTVPPYLLICCCVEVEWTYRRFWLILTVSRSRQSEVLNTG